MKSRNREEMNCFHMVIIDKVHKSCPKGKRLPFSKQTPSLAPPDDICAVNTQNVFFRSNHSHNNKCKVLGNVISSDLRTDTHLKSESRSNEDTDQALTLEAFAPGTFSSFT